MVWEQLYFGLQLYVYRDRIGHGGFWCLAEMPTLKNRRIACPCLQECREVGVAQVTGQALCAICD